MKPTDTLTVAGKQLVPCLLCTSDPTICDTIWSERFADLIISITLGTEINVYMHSTKPGFDDTLQFHLLNLRAKTPKEEVEKEIAKLIVFCVENFSVVLYNWAEIKTK